VAEIVAVFAATHTPLFLLRRNDPAQDVQDEVFSCYEGMGKAMIDRGAEALVIFGNDHLHAFFLDRYPSLAVGVQPAYRNVTSEAYMPEVEGGRPGDEKLGRYLVKALLDGDFDPTVCQEIGIDHSLVSPLHLMGDPAIPMVPILQNTVAPPLPPARRSYQLGITVRRALEAYSGADRVAVLATGGPSHWIGTPELGRIDEKWDGKVIDLLREGNPKRLSEWSQKEIDAGGNGGNEIRAWLSAAALAGGTPADLLMYRPEPLWFLGVTALEWKVGPAL
jgi:hypothetical protein